MRYVEQLEPMGCGPACVAMVLGEDYFAARARFRDSHDFSARGLSHSSLDRELVKAGYAVARSYPEPGRAWPPPPYAPVHICRVRTKAMVGPQRVHHYVVMDASGIVHDPDKPGNWRLSDYTRVLDIAGLYEI